MSEIEYAPIPRVAVAAAGHGVWIENVGLLSESDCARFIGWASSALKKARRRREAFAPAVSITDDSMIVVDRIGNMSIDGALLLANRLADAAIQLKGQQ